MKPKKSRPAPVKYPGDLAKSGRRYALNLAGMLAKHGEQSESLLESVDQTLSKYEQEILLLLMEHYRISPNDAGAWIKLAYALALDHVPAMSSAKAVHRGRPKKIKLPLPQAKKKKSGRPVQWNESNCRSLLAHLERGTALVEAQGRRPTNRAALEAVYLAERKDGFTKGMSAQACREMADKNARRIPDARTSLRKRK